MRTPTAIAMLLGAYLVSPIQASEVRMQVAEEGPFTVGDAVRVLVEVDLDPGERVATPDWAGSWLQPSTAQAAAAEPTEGAETDTNETLPLPEIVSTTAPVVAAGDAGSTWTQIITLRSFRPGAVTLPAPEIGIDTGDGVHTIAGETIGWQVESVLPTDRQVSLQPPAPLRDVSIGRTFWITATVFLIAALATAWFAHRAGAFGSETASHRVRDPLTALRIALRSLDPKQPAESHIGLSSSLRDYLDQRAGVRGREHTTSEIYRDLKQLPVSDNSTQEVRKLLTDCDRVKFGRHSASPSILTERVRRTQTIAEEIDARLAAEELSAEARRAAKQQKASAEGADAENAA